MNSKIFDCSILESWHDVDPDNWRQIANDIVVAFLDCSQIQDFTNAWADRDLTKLRFAAHTLKSSFGILGAARARTILQEIEDLSREGDSAKVAAAVALFEDILEPSMNHILQFQARVLKQGGTYDQDSF